PAHVHAAHQTLEIGRARLQALGHLRLKRFLGPAQLRHGELQQTGLALDVLRFIAVAPAHSLPHAAPIMLTAEKRGGLRFDGHLQHVARESSNEAHHRGLRAAIGSAPSNRPLISSFKRTLGGTLFEALISSGPATNEAALVLVTRRIPTPLCFYRKFGTSPRAEADHFTSQTDDKIST